ncbi:MAG TPA: Gfo/Idh/MocA family oxidoreductase [Thermomicrobiales bacterium]|nr:Gfo/Idh/MocA family oxidoreductase [Thermomicrobiales bacterium]
MKRYVLAGASGRGLSMFARPIVERFPDCAQLVGVFDVNSVRAAYVAEQAGGVPVFDDFDRMVVESNSDRLIVATIDRVHHEYIIRGLEAGLDVITEKPMTIDAEKCRAILEAERRTGRKLTVTLNYRFMPYVTRVKELLRAGSIGPVSAVDFEWFLDTRHGADYFRRWHRRKANSGGLLVHKASHHFDMINWWLEREPAEIFARGARHVYGPTRVERGERCCTCAYAETCEFFVDLRDNAALKALYFDAEHVDGYHRDGCVFADEIDIEDTMSVTAAYDGDALLTYSLIAYAPYEGWRATLTGTRGRMELFVPESGPLSDVASDEIMVFDRSGLTVHSVTRSAGGHGGADEQLWERLFREQPVLDPLNYDAGSREGAMSMLIGAAANESIASGQPVRIADLLGEDEWSINERGR